MQGTDLADIVREQALLDGDDGFRVTYQGPRLMLESQRAVQMSLVLHELATNARKYGALSVPTGRLAVTWKVVKRELRLTWQESGVANLTRPRSSGFGTTLIERTLEAYGGSAEIRYRADGIVCELHLELPQGSDTAVLQDRESSNPSQMPAKVGRSLASRRVLVVEDEAVIAMDLQARLHSFGCEVVGPAATATKAIDLIESTGLDLALLDANLGGEPVDDIAATLRQRGVPFIFVTGYGRDGLPAAYREAPVLSKPVNSTTLLRGLELLLQGAS